MKIILFLLTGLSLVTTSALAQLNVIADLGGEDASPYFEGINRQPVPTPTPIVPPVPASADEAEAAMLPVATPELTPGDVADRPLQLPGIGALFLVGDDDTSRAWLRANADALRTKHAAGLVVNISDRAALQALRDLAPGIPMAPASGSELARRLQLTHYPVLITDTGLTQRVTP
ncbi:integrating conjugative element protein [Serratia ureilytica]|uniref:integrating conjugative element protein n=1 Tax=Serratia ureilytica TaxID=300181 RepID=UPI0039B69165